MAKLKYRKKRKAQRRSRLGELKPRAGYKITRAYHRQKTSGMKKVGSLIEVGRSADSGSLAYGANVCVGGSEWKTLLGRRPKDWNRRLASGRCVTGYGPTPTAAIRNGLKELATRLK